MTVPITMKVVTAATLVASPPPVQTYTKGSGAANYPTWTVNLSAGTVGQIYTVNQASLGTWLTATPMIGARGTNDSILFQATGGIDSLAAQNAVYVQPVHIGVSGYADTVVNIDLSVSSPASTLSFAEGIVRNLTWVQGQSIPSAIITAVSSNSPIQYSTTTGGALAPAIAGNEQSGLAYNFGTQIPVTFSNLAFSEAQPGNVLKGTVTFAWGSTTSTVTFYVTVQAGTSTALLGSSIPSNLPSAVAGEQFTLTLYGSGFVPVNDPTQRTTVGIVSSGVITPDSNILNTSVVNSSTIVLTIQAPTSDTLLPWNGTNVEFGVCNPAGGTCNAPTGTLFVSIGAGPTIAAVVSASSQASSVLNVAPYDILTIWGSNFCTSSGTGCGANGVLYGQLNPSTMTYATSLSPDGGQRNLTVGFRQHNTGSYVSAPLLFANNSQINLVVPASGYPTSGAVDVLVTFAGLTSNVFEVTATATDPGIFTIDAYGQGAILNPNYSVANGSTPAVTGTIVSIYATGLGAPTSMTNTTQVSYNSIDCITPAIYETTAGNGASVDGALIQSALLGGDLPPCFGTGNAPTAITVGGLEVTAIDYAGWVSDSVAGLYQVNATLHAALGAYTDAAGTSLTAITSPVQLPVKITSTLTSQAPGADLGLNPGVTMWVAPPGLTLTETNAVATVAASAAWTPIVTATGGVGTYTFQVDGAASSAVTSTGGVAYSVASPALTFATAPTTAGVYIFTVTAKDANGSTGSLNITLTVTGDSSTVTASASPVTATAVGTANAAITTVTGGGGTGPYIYTLAGPSAVMFSIAGGVVSYNGGGEPGVYHLDVTVTDTLSATRDIYFDVPIAVVLTVPNNVTTFTGVAALSLAQPLVTVGYLGDNTIAFTLIQPDSAKCTMTIPGGVLTVPSTGCVAGTYSVTVVGTDASGDNGSTAAVATLNLSVHLN